MTTGVASGLASASIDALVAPRALTERLITGCAKSFVLRGMAQAATPQPHTSGLARSCSAKLKAQPTGHGRDELPMLLAKT
jgi:hypothetical protein